MYVCVYDEVGAFREANNLGKKYRAVRKTEEYRPFRWDAINQLQSIDTRRENSQ